MDVYEELLYPKKLEIDSFGVNDSKTVEDAIDSTWPKIESSLLEAFLRKKGIHTDEYENFDSYVPEILEMVREHVHVYYIDQRKDQLHYISIQGCRFVRPYDRTHGLDNPERALMRGNYEGTVYGTVKYQILCRQDDKHSDSSVGNVDVESVVKKKYNSCGGISLYAQFAKLVHCSTKENHTIMDIPVLLNSTFCHTQTPYATPSLFTKPYLNVPVYCVNRNFKICPLEEYLINNRIIVHRTFRVEIRSKFYEKCKRFRTNSTLKISMDTLKIRRNEQWMQPVRFMVEIPHEHPKVSIPVTVLALAFGCSVEEFIRTVVLFLSQTYTDNQREIDMFLNILGTDKCGCSNQREAFVYFGSCLNKCRNMSSEQDIIAYVQNMIKGEIFPQAYRESQEPMSIDAKTVDIQKFYLLAQCCAKLIALSPLVNEKYSAESQVKATDKRSYVYKRLDTPGEKLTKLTRKYIKHYVKKAASRLRSVVTNKKTVDINDILNKNIIKLTSSVKNGIWDSKSDVSDNNQNKTQMMITGFCSDAMHMQSQKIVKHGMKKSSDPEPLLTHPTQIGRVDPYLTPESDKCGIIRYKALGCVITPFVNLSFLNTLISAIIERNTSSIGWVPVVDHLGRLHPCTPTKLGAYTAVFDVYSCLIGWVSNPVGLYKIFRDMRRRSQIYVYLSISVDKPDNGLYFNADAGRMVRPLIVLEKINDLLRTVRASIFRHHRNPVGYLVQNGMVEYLDAAEEYSGLVLTADSIENAVMCNLEQTHLEIHGSLLLAITVSKAFSNFNQGPRRMYTGNMEKRSLALKLYVDRGTTTSYCLHHAQLPILSDPVDEALNLRVKEPNGININLAILSMGENQEDAWIMKKEAIERGVGMSSESHIVTSTRGFNCTFCKPGNNCKGKAEKSNYTYLNDDGTPVVGSILKGGSAVIGKVYTLIKKKKRVTRCVSRFIPWNTTYTVVSVTKFPDHKVSCRDDGRDGGNCRRDLGDQSLGHYEPDVIRVELRRVNIPSIGDKMYLAHGQKGTCGNIVPSWDLPFICSGPNAGTSPDLVINVCSLMRITQGLLIETHLGKSRALSSTLLSQYNTIFLSERNFQNKLKIACQILKMHGLEYTGRDQMQCGKTGRMLKCGVFNGMAHLRILKHMAKDKLRSRDRGPVNELTRQTSVGKKHFGGQKVGEMENWNMHCHGMAHMFQNINYESADKFQVFYCTRCNSRAIGCIQSSFYLCASCESSDCIVRLKIPYITTLTFQELYTAGFGHTMIAEPVSKDQRTMMVDEDDIFSRNQHIKL